MAGKAIVQWHQSSITFLMEMDLARAFIMPAYNGDAAATAIFTPRKEESRYKHRRDTHGLLIAPIGADALISMKGKQYQFDLPHRYPRRDTGQFPDGISRRRPNSAAMDFDHFVLRSPARRSAQLPCNLHTFL